MDKCIECGAPAVDGLTCREQLGWVIAWEAQDADLGAVHFLTVASYNLQHPSLFDEDAIAALQAAFEEHLDDGLPVAEIRRRMAKSYSGAQRVLNRTSTRRPALRLWRMTIADVYAQGSPAGASARVRMWADSIRGELPPAPASI